MHIIQADKIYISILQYKMLSNWLLIQYINSFVYRLSLVSITILFLDILLNHSNKSLFLFYSSYTQYICKDK